MPPKDFRRYRRWLKSKNYTIKLTIPHVENPLSISKRGRITCAPTYRDRGSLPKLYLSVSEFILGVPLSRDESMVRIYSHPAGFARLLYIRACGTRNWNYAKTRY